MAYIGNQVTSSPFVTDTYTGTGSQTSFLGLTYAPAAPSSIAPGHTYQGGRGGSGVVIIKLTGAGYFVN